MKTNTDTTLLKYIKQAKNDSSLFKIENVSNNHKRRLYINEYNGEDWVFLVNRKIKPSKINLEQYKIYELIIKTRKWGDMEINTFHLTPHTDNSNNKPIRNKPICLFSH